MTLNIPDKADGPSRVLFNALADISMSMMTICENLGSNPAVIAATRGCDLRRYQGSMLGEEFSSFEAYVEAETRAGALFCWSLEIDQTSLGWTFERQVSKQARDGAKPEKIFQDYTFATVDDLANNWSVLMTEFEDSAKHFDFGG
jgi:hypothetical protein